jgi:alpha-methylacyl-CoA racemase
MRGELVKPPLAGIRIIEFAAMGPAPFAGLMLANMGAELIRIDRVGADIAKRDTNPQLRGRRSIALDLKRERDLQVAARLIDSADALIEGHRPGVMERMGLGPDECLARNPRLVYGRMTGWGQTGPLARAAGHDLNYLAITGVLHAIGRKGQKPSPPLNIIGDYGGGGPFLAFGILAALFQARATGQGQVIDAAIVDGVSCMATTLHWMTQTGLWNDTRGDNAYDSGDPFFDCYETSDGKYVAIATIEPKFYAELRARMGLDGPEWDLRSRETWPRQRALLETIFKGKTREEWSALLEGTDACFAPVLTLAEARTHPHNLARGTFIEGGPLSYPAAAPRLSGAGRCETLPPPLAGADTAAILRELGIDPEEITA